MQLDMSGRRIRYSCRLVAVIIGLVCSSAVLRCQEPLKATPCELKRNPANYNHKLVEVTGFVSHGFEDFGLFDPSCPSWPYVWLEYGGTNKSGTMYCCGASADRSRPKDLVVEGVAVPLTADESFSAFDKLVVTERDTVIHATLVGRFFAGKETKFPEFRGYGHMGCCSLLAIQEVVSVAPHDQEDLDYRSSADRPDVDKVGCGYQFLSLPWTYGDWVKAQHAADVQDNPSAFHSPREVAVAAFMRLAKVDERTAAKLNETKHLQGRVIYELKTNRPKTTYMVVVSKPYVLSFYARDPQKVAWVVIGAYKSGC